MTETRTKYETHTVPAGGATRTRLRYEGEFKPYVRMTQRGKFVKPEAKDYLSSKAAMALAFKQHMNGNLLERKPITVDIIIHHKGGYHHRDLDNEIKAIFDACNGTVWEDDRWVDVVRAKRKRGDRDLIIVDVEQDL